VSVTGDGGYARKTEVKERRGEAVGREEGNNEGTETAVDVERNTVLYGKI